MAKSYKQVDPQRYIQAKLNSGDAFQNEWSEISNLLSKKHYHQLSLFVEEIVQRDDFKAEVDLRKLYEDFLAGFTMRLNILVLSRIIILISQQLKVTESTESSMAFLHKFAMHPLNSNESKAMVFTKLGMMYLHDCGDKVNARLMIEEAEKELDEIGEMVPAHGPFYKLSSSYYSVMKNYGRFYREALKYLGCLKEENVKQLPKSELEEWSVKLCVSALLGRDIYNFGELLMHNIVHYVPSNSMYLLELVRQFNGGCLDELNEIMNQITKQPDLAEDIAFLKEKITLMALVETVFQQPVNKRTVKMTDVASATRVELANVELLVMKAMSKGLIKGLIDEVNQTIHITWVQPRVLNNSQIEVAMNNFKEWSSKVNEMRELIITNTSEILA